LGIANNIHFQKDKYMRRQKTFWFGLIIFLASCKANIFSTVPSVTSPSPSYFFTLCENTPTTTSLGFITKSFTITPTYTPMSTYLGGGGNKIAYSALDPEWRIKYLPRHIYSINKDGSEMIQLTNGEFSESTPSWSPDGKQIVYSYADGGTTTIYIMASDGKNSHILIKEPVLDWNPSWTPNGKKIAFVSMRDDSAPWTCKKNCNAEIYIMDSDGSNIDRLTNSPNYDFYPSWSPDGEKIVFTSERDGNYEIYIMDRNGYNQVRLTNNDSEDIQPSWSPDGKHILFMSNRDGQFDIYQINTDGTNLIKFTDSPAWDGDPAWSPDGTKIAFVSNRDAINYSECTNNCNYEIYIMNANGKDQTRITNTPLMESSPAWQPK
jgi:Tol biopolymer transport system component